MEGFTGEDPFRGAADWEPEVTATVVVEEAPAEPAEEVTRFAGQTMTLGAARRIAAEATWEGMGG